MAAEGDAKPVLDYPDGDALVGDCHPHEALVLKVLAEDGGPLDDATLCAKVGALAKSAIAYPPMQRPASFNMDAIKEQVAALGLPNVDFLQQGQRYQFVGRQAVRTVS